MVWDLYQNRNTNKRNGIEIPEKNPDTEGQLIFKKVAKAFQQGEKIIFSTNEAGSIAYKLKRKERGGRRERRD